LISVNDPKLVVVKVAGAEQRCQDASGHRAEQRQDQALDQEAAQDGTPPEPERAQRTHLAHRVATWAYMVIIAPSVAPKAKNTAMTVPRLDEGRHGPAASS